MTQEQAMDYGTAGEVYVDGLERIETLGVNVVWVGYRLQTDPSDQSKFNRVVALKIITPLSAVPSIARKIMETFGMHVMQRTWGRVGKRRDLVAPSRH